VIYLDHNASTPVDPEVADYIHAILKSDFGNPSSSHEAGLRSRKSIETARSQVAGLIGASADEITFTSGGTESNNLAIIGSLQTRKRGHIITSTIEHPSVINP
jgi:cysteine desulfurase